MQDRRRSSGPALLGESYRIFPKVRAPSKGKIQVAGVHGRLGRRTRVVGWDIRPRPNPESTPGYPYAMNRDWLVLEAIPPLFPGQRVIIQPLFFFLSFQAMMNPVCLCHGDHQCLLPLH